MKLSSSSEYSVFVTEAKRFIINYMNCFLSKLTILQLENLNTMHNVNINNLTIFFNNIVFVVYIQNEFIGTALW